MTKTVGEAWCGFYHRRFGLDARVGRPGAVVGPGRVAGGAASSWTTALIEEPLRGHPYVCPVAEDAASTLVYHTDLVEGLLRLCRAETVPSRIYNLGACSASAGEIARLVRQRVPDARISFQPDPVAQFVVGRWRYAVQDNERAARDLGWRARFATPAALVAACAEEITRA
jgi:nucleoside-diphosphate-sugar epimerase